MKPKVSIVVPIYNMERYLEKCINSILKQTLSNIELILVNDGSTDKSGELCDRYAQIDKRIKVIHKENGGVSSARNAGLQVVNGDYIGFVDPDDYIDEQMYKALYNQAIHDFSSIVLCDFYTVSEDGQLLNHTDKDENNEKSKQYTNIEALKEMFNIEKVYNLGTEVNPKWIIMCNKIFSRNLFKELRFVENRIYEDEYIAHELLYRSKKVSYIPKKYYYYVQRENSLSNFSFNMKKFERIYALKQRADFFKEKGLYELHYKTLKGLMDSFFWNYYVAKTTLPNVRKDLKRVKKPMNKSFYSFIRNPLLNWKQKVFVTLFILNPLVLDLSKELQLRSQRS